MESFFKRVEQPSLAKLYVFVALIAFPLIFVVWFPDSVTGERRVIESISGTALIITACFLILRFKQKEERVVLINKEGITEGNIFRNWNNISSIYPVTVSLQKKTYFIGGDLRRTGIIGFVVRLKNPLTQEEYIDLIDRIRKHVIPEHPHLKVKSKRFER